MEKLREFLKHYTIPIWSVPLLLFSAAYLSYGLLISDIGLHWDDLPSIWFLHNWGPKIFPQVFAIDRPLQGWLFVITSSIIGESQVGWHLFGIISRCLAGLALFWTLRLLWPKNSEQAAWISLLVVIYPGFTQQFISITYGHQFLILTIFFLSLGFMLLAWRKPAWAWPLTILSLLLGICTMLMLEYFVGLELIRPLLLWLVIREKERDKKHLLRRVTLRWLPYSVVLVTFVIWRLLNKTPRGDIIIFDRLRTTPLMTIIELSGTVVQDAIEAGIVAWVKLFDFSALREFISAIILRYALLVAACTALVFLLLYLLRQNSIKSGGSINRREWARQALLLGIFALFVSGVPVWVTNLHIDLSFPWNRFTIPMMTGAVVALVGLIELLNLKRAQSILIVAILAGLAAGSHYQTAQRFRMDWLIQRSLMWQLVWRAPMIEPGTVLLTSELGLMYSTDNSLSSTLNWTYGPNLQGRQMEYLLYDLQVRTNTSIRLPDLKPDVSINEPYRATEFIGNTSQALVVLYQPPSCLKVLDPTFDRLLPNKPLHIRQALALSKPELIIANPEYAAKPPQELLGSEIEHEWCYYFQKAELARQKEDWETIVTLGQTALRLNEMFHKRSVSELTIYIEGYARSGRWQKALALTQRSFNENEENLLMLCDTWARLAEAAASDENGQATLDSVRLELACPAP